MNSTTKHLIVIAGPTAVGKTTAALAVAQHFDTAIISADSRQCYREMSIGTAKPTAEELAAIPHYFINTHSIKEELSAADFERLALGYADEIFTTRRVAIVCGGTGLYLKALCEGIDEMPQANDEIAKTLYALFLEKGIIWLQTLVREEDPEFYQIAEQQNPTRLIRALSFKRTTGLSILHFRKDQKKERPFRIHKFCLTLPRPVLYERINQRVDGMMEAGLLEEVQQLLPYRNLKNLHTVGYTELFQYLDGNLGLPKAVDLIKQHSRNYAKRQLTWFQKDPEFQWLSPQHLNSLIAAISKAL